MERLDNILDKILKELGIERAVKAGEAVLKWEDIKKDFGIEGSKALYVRKNILYIEARSPSLRQRISMLKEKIIERLKKEGIVLEDIKFGRRIEK